MKAYERLMRYAALRTPSDENAADKTPSTEAQFQMTELLAEEMRAMGLAEVYADEHAYVYGKLPATPGYEDRTPIGLIAHIDTVPVPEDGVVRPTLVPNYDGGDVPLGSSGLTLSPAMFPHLPDLAGQDLIVTDGTTVLGADDKAGVAEILAAVERVMTEGIPHGPVSLCFTPDEEIGHGAALLDLDRFGAKIGYTVDGGDLSEIENETFNAAAAKWTLRGVEVHPGSAKGIMRNAALLAAELIGMLPADETPGTTEDREGFYHLCDLRADVGRAELSYILRDHDRAKFEARKERMRAIEAALNGKYGPGTAVLTLRDQYYNMAEVLKNCPEALEKAEEAVRAAGLDPVYRPIRGGTDGSQLSFRGLPCPNLGTGGFGFHGPYEHITVQRMDKMTDILTELIRAFAR